MKILAQQLTLDLYNCNQKRLADVDEINKILKDAVGEEPKLSSGKISEHHCSIIGAFDEGHIALHVYADLRYVAADIFTCTANIEPEKIEVALKKYFQPDKIKSTFLKRGDFGKSEDIKPKIKTHFAALRKVRNAGEKVVKKLVRGGDH